jgi:hypothetical protein
MPTEEKILKLTVFGVDIFHNFRRGDNFTVVCRSLEWEAVKNRSELLPFHVRRLLDPPQFEKACIDLIPYLIANVSRNRLVKPLCIRFVKDRLSLGSPPFRFRCRLNGGDPGNRKVGRHGSLVERVVSCVPRIEVELHVAASTRQSKIVQGNVAKARQIET